MGQRVASPASLHTITQHQAGVEIHVEALPTGILAADGTQNRRFATSLSGA